MWVKEPQSGGNDVTGTVVMMFNDPAEDSGNVDERNAKSELNNDSPRPQDHLKQTKEGIVLNPQPQDDPNDPLNWPMWRRDVALLTVSIFALLAGGQTPILAPVMNVLGKEFDRPLHDLTYLVGVFMAAMGVGSALFAPLAVNYGKRVVYLASLLIFLAGLIWAANATSYSSLMGARVLSGIGCSPAESLPSTTIAEIYFAHERAYRIGIYTLLLLGGKNLSPLVSAFTANRLGWHWIFWVCAIICGASFVAMYLFVHETWWQRVPVPDKRSQEETEAARKARQHSDHQMMRRDTSHSLQNAPTIDLEELPKEGVSAQSSSLQNPSNEDVPKRVPFFRNLRIYSGKQSDAKLWVVFFRPIMLYIYPPVLFASLVYGTSVVWLSVIAETITSIFSTEPYNFKTTSIGLLYVATFVGSLLGSLVAGKVSDVVVRFICRRNGGIYEPEFRLVMIAPVMLAITIGLMGFGWSTQAHDLWIVPAIFLGVLGFGTSLASTVSITYVVDCYRKLALESLVSLNLAKNLMGLGFSIFVPYFFEAAGSRISYVVYGCVEIALCLTAIPLYHYGKVLRRYYDNKAWIDILYK